MAGAGKEMRFDGRVAIVTGAGRGIGREYALLLAQRGAKVVVNDLGTEMSGHGQSTTPAQDVVHEITRKGGTAVPSYDSVATPAGSAAIVATALQNFGRIDALINNAAILRPMPFGEATAESLVRHFEVHMLGTMLMCKAVWPHMVKARYGRIVNTVSGSIFGLPNHSEYASAKGAIFVFTRALALEAAEHGIRVNAISPQGATRQLEGAKLDPEMKARLQAVMRPALVAPGGVFLAHQDCNLSGETLAVSGGKVCRIGLTENAGFTDPDLTPEVIAARLPEALDESTARHWRSSVEKYAARTSE